MKFGGISCILGPPKDAEWLKAKREEDEEDLPATFFRVKPSPCQTVEVSNEKTPGCLGYMSGIENYKPLQGSLQNNKYNGKSLNKNPKVYVERIILSSHI